MTNRADARGGTDSPRVSVGLPVHNGERFVERALRCHLAQDYRDLEVIVGDNASTDDTLAICRRVADEDPRVLILTSDRNRGAVPNFNRVLAAARGEYFKWAADDDWCTADFVGRAVQRLNAEPGAVLAYAPMGVEDDQGTVFRWHDEVHPGFRSPRVEERLRALAWRLGDPTALIFGLLRTGVLRRAGGVPNTPEPDRTLLTELILHGTFLHLDEPVFVHYGPPGHMLHYTDETVPPGRRSWVWLHPDNVDRPKLATLRIARAHAVALREARHLGGARRLRLAAELGAAMLVTRLRSKAHRLWRRRGPAPSPTERPTPPVPGR